MLQIVFPHSDLWIGSIDLLIYGKDRHVSVAFATADVLTLIQQNGPLNKLCMNCNSKSDLQP